jgi:hypothetical protein
VPGTTTLARTPSSERTSPRITAFDERDSAEAYEGRSWDAWWRSDAAAVFQARERAYRLFQRTGDRRGAGRMSIWLGCDHLEFRGEPAVARGCGQRARRLLKGLPVAPDHGWLALHEGAVAAES